LASLSAADTLCASRPGPATCSQCRLSRRVVLDRHVLGDRSDDPCDAIPKAVPDVVYAGNRFLDRVMQPRNDDHVVAARAP
jgi:hypothetical protein